MFIIFLFASLQYRSRVVGNKESLLLRLIGESGNMGIWRKHLLDKVKGDISQAEFKKILEVCVVLIVCEPKLSRPYCTYSPFCPPAFCPYYISMLILFVILTPQALEKSNKIKTVSSVREPRKKLYMLFGTEPNTAITGGTWYSDADFDAEFVNIVYKTCYEYLANRVCSRSCALV